MKTENIEIGGIPAVIFGDNSLKLFLFIHGQGGSKDEAGRFAEIAVPFGYQVLGIDLPEHGGRQDGAKFLPWEVVPELEHVMKYAKGRWGSISIRAISIGAWFSMLAFKGEKIDKCLFSSPLVDMENMISNLMKWSGVSEERLQKEKEIPTDFGQTLSWRYLCYAREHKVHAYCHDTAVLYATGDELIPKTVIERFVSDNSCRIQLIDGGEHWLHTPDEIEIMNRWEEKELKF